jgi:hypothetical protein
MQARGLSLAFRQRNRNISALLGLKGELRPVPRYTAYRYAVVNNRRVIVDPQTRRIIKIME